MNKRLGTIPKDTCLLSIPSTAPQHTIACNQAGQQLEAYPVKWTVKRYVTEIIAQLVQFPAGTTAAASIT